MDYLLAPIRRYADFNGRASRRELWASAASLMLAYWFASTAGRVLSAPLAAVAVLLALLCPAASVAVRRLHDMNRTGKWLAVLMVAPTGVLWLAHGFSGASAAAVGAANLLAVGLQALAALVLLLAPGTEGGNDYGDVPSERIGLRA